MTARLIHLSDLHAGAREEPEIETPLRALIARLEPDLIVATGDLTHRGRRREHQHAAAFLNALGPPVLAVPGNHDIPRLPPARMRRPWREFERAWGTTEPLLATDGLYVVGINSVRPWRHQSGAASARSLEHVAVRLSAAPREALRVVALHHHLTGAPWRTRKRPLARRGRVLEALARAGADLVVAGHIHQSALAERREFEVLAHGQRSCVVATAPGLGQPRPRRRGEARGLHAYETSDGELRADTYLWRDGRFELAVSRRFPRGSREPERAPA